MSLDFTVKIKLLLLGFGLLVLGSMVILIACLTYELYIDNNACEDLGYVELGRTVNNIDTCKDHNGNLDYVDFVHKDFKSTARRIEIK